MATKPANGTALVTGTPIIASLVAAWLMAENSGTSVGDGASSPAAGTLTGATLPAWTTGNFGGPALSFNGTTAYVNLGTPPAAKLQIDTLTIVTWVNFSASATMGIVCDYLSGDGSGNYLFRTQSSGGGNKLQYWNQQGNNGTAVIANSGWHQVAFSRSGSSGSWSWKLYIDGQLDNSGTATTNPTHGAGQQGDFGKQGGDASGFLSGLQDHVFMWGRQLADAEIAALYTNPFAIYQLALSPLTLPNGDKNSAYSQTLSTTGGTGPYTYAVTAGTLPTSLTLTTGGVLSGTPTVAGLFTFTVTATDSGTNTGSVIYNVTINPTLIILTQVLSNGHTGVAYSQQLVSSGGTG